MITIELTEQQYLNLLSFLQRTPMNGKEAIVYIDILQTLRKKQPE